MDKFKNFSMGDSLLLFFTCNVLQRPILIFGHDFLSAVLPAGRKTHTNIVLTLLQNNTSVYLCLCVQVKRLKQNYDHYGLGGLTHIQES